MADSNYDRPRAPALLGSLPNPDAPFDASHALARIAHFWSTSADYGYETRPLNVFFDEIVSDRYILCRGMQLVHDELQLAGRAVARDDFSQQISECGADFELPSVVCTLGHTNCGDRIHQSDSMELYASTVASRFATISETGLPKMESFAPTGGGTDHPGTLAHVTVAHHLDPALRDMIYKGNPASFLLFCVDLMTHCGRNTQNDEHTLEFGMARESYWRAPRTACGAIVGCLNAYDHENAVHRRLRDHLGEANFQFLKNKDEANRVLSDNNPQLKGLTYLVAAAIVSIYGCVNTLREFAHQMDERGVATCTASITVNRPGSSETIFYLCRGTTFQDVVQYQGFGMDATKYRASIVKHRVELKYDGQGGADGVFPVIREELPRPAAGHGHGGH